MHIPAGLAPAIHGTLWTGRDLDEVLQQRYGVVVDEVRQVVEATILPSGSARMLDVPDRSAGLLLKRSAYSGGIPVAFSVSTYRADRCRLHVDCAAPAAS